MTADTNSRKIVIRDLELAARIGVHGHERQNGQTVRFNIEVSVDPGPIGDRLDDVVSYEDLVGAIKALLAEGHINLAETLAERVAGLCLADPRAISARVRVEKLDAVAEAAGAGAEVVRSRGSRTSA